jgi:hypothetical protein
MEIGSDTGSGRSGNVSVATDLFRKKHLLLIKPIFTDVVLSRIISVLQHYVSD